MSEENADLKDIAPELPVPGARDVNAQKEWTTTFSADKSKPQLQNERYHTQTSIIKDEHRNRWVVFIAVFLSVMAWLGFTLMVVLLQGYSGSMKEPVFRLSEGVMLSFFGVGAVNVIGLLVIAAKYVFPNRPWWLRRAHDPPRGK